ncbi:MAG: putative sulfate exporter family transporter, partial [Nitrososphaerota archaeon]|nr:putative sulfate exporter family transporter [Nitrososphaerota archaeon]
LESSYVMPIFHIPAPVIGIMIAAVISIVVANVYDLPKKFQGALKFTSHWLLKLGIVLYGFNFSYILWFQPGASWIFVIGLLTVAIPMSVSYILGRILHLGENAGILVGVGTSVCGISAIVATQHALKSDEESAGMALATILVFGTMVLFVYPPIAHLLSLNSTFYGVWTGATTLDLPQLVAAALQGGGQSSLIAGLWVKSIRIGLLAPVIFLVIAFSARNAVKKSRNGQYIDPRNASWTKAALGSFPIFILIFFAAILLNTIYPLPSWIASPLATGKGEFLSLNLANILLTSAIIAICLRVKREVVGKTGAKILFVGGVSWLIQSLVVFWLAGNVPIPHV